MSTNKLISVLVWFTVILGPVSAQNISNTPVTVVNGADFMPGPVGIGSIAAAFGDFGNVVATNGLVLSEDGRFYRRLPTEVAGVTASLLGAGTPGLPLHLFFVSPGQINFQVPKQIQPGTYSIEVSSPSTISRGTFVVQEIAPAMFLVDAEVPPGLLVVANNGRQTVTRNNPALPSRQVLTTFFTGCGKPDPADDGVGGFKQPDGTPEIRVFFPRTLICLLCR
jgi:uncharacterized protein (TIGR03437 family)